METFWTSRSKKQSNSNFSRKRQKDQSFHPRRSIDGRKWLYIDI